MPRLDCDCYADAPKDLQFCPLHHTAPELFEALVAVVDGIDELSADTWIRVRGVIGETNVDRARAAIAAAKGQGPVAQARGER